MIPVANLGLTSYVVANLPAATYFFACTAYDAQGVESSYSARGWRECRGAAAGDPATRDHFVG